MAMAGQWPLSTRTLFLNRRKGDNRWDPYEQHGTQVLLSEAMGSRGYSVERGDNHSLLSLILATTAPQFGISGVLRSHCIFTYLEAIYEAMRRAMEGNKAQSYDPIGTQARVTYMESQIAALKAERQRLKLAITPTRTAGLEATVVSQNFGFDPKQAIYRLNEIVARLAHEVSCQKQQLQWYLKIPGRQTQGRMGIPPHVPWSESKREMRYHHSRPMK